MWQGFVVLLIFAVWAFLDYDFAPVASSLAEANWALIGLGMTLNVSLLYLRVFKWRFFLSAFKTFSFFNMSLAAFAAYTCNMVIPAKVGGAIQAWLLSKKEPISASSAFGTVVLTRVMDAITLSVIGLLVFSTMEIPLDKSHYWESYRNAGIIITVSLLSLIVFLFIFRNHKNIENGFKRLAIRFVPARMQTSTEKVITLFWEGFEVLNQRRTLGIIVILNFTFWGLVATTIFIYIKAFGISDIPMTAPLFILLAQAIGFMIPSPGNIGPFHAATVVGLSFYGVVGELALSIAIIMHAAMFITNSLPGLIYLWIGNLKISAIIREAELNLTKANENT